MTKPTQDEIDEQVNLAVDTEDRSRWPGMSYEAGVSAALRWATGESDQAPMDEE